MEYLVRIPTSIEGEPIAEYSASGINITAWHKRAGEVVQKGELLFSLNTDKTDIDIISEVTGTLKEILLPAGSLINDLNKITPDGEYLDTPIAVIHIMNGTGIPLLAAQDEKTDDKQYVTPKPPERKSGKPVVSAKAFELIRTHNLVISDIAKFAPDGHITEETLKEYLRAHAQEPPAAAENGQNTTARAIPAARTLALKHNMDLSQIQGSGPDGVILVSDIERILGDRPESEGGQSGVEFEAAILPAGSQMEIIKPNPIRRAIAKSMQEGITIPTAGSAMFFDFSPLMTFRTKYAKGFENAFGVRFRTWVPIAFAFVRALKEEKFTIFNAYWEWKSADYKDAAICEYPSINLGISYDNGSGLRILNLKGAENSDFADFACRADDLLTRMRAQKLNPSELRGYTIIFNNIGALGHDFGHSILTPGISAMLNLGRMEQGSGKGILQLFFDHRMFDGSLTGELMKEVYRILCEEIVPELTELCTNKKGG